MCTTNQSRPHPHGPHDYFSPNIPFGAFTGDFSHIAKHFMNFMPHELTEDKDFYYVTIPLPGYDVKEIEVAVRDNEILIEAKHPEPETKPEPTETEPKEKGPAKPQILIGGSYLWDRPIHLTIPVDQKIDPENVKAHLKKGLLHVQFKKEPVPTTHIKVEDAESE
ncbi:MAG: Hsp20/alpha crystallin family protein [Promethearchaeota archaeon]